MDRILQAAWDHHGARYSWALAAVVFVLALPIFFFLSFVIVAFEKSNRYVEATGITIVAVLMFVILLGAPSRGVWRRFERWAAGEAVDRVETLKSTYALARKLPARLVLAGAGSAAALSIAVGMVAGATPSRFIQYAIVGATIQGPCQLIGVHSLVQAIMRPVRTSLVASTEIGDSLPRFRPSFATWSKISMLGVALAFAVESAMLTAVFDRASEMPVLWVVIGCVLTLVIGVPITVGAAFAPSLRPIRDLAEGTKRVAAGDYSQRLPVVQDDDLGALAGSFNRMQAGLAERQRLHAAFGTYVDPALAARLLEQGDDVFTGERREVTVMFVDVRDFTPFAEANTAEDTVACLNALFEVVVPAVVDAGGHVNKFLGDGALAVFGAPNALARHAEAATGAALLIHRLVAERFSGALRIGIGINTGVVIAGTVGGGSKLEFTLIGDAVNVAARVEQLTKTNGDAILLTQHTVDALESPPPGLIYRGSHALKGKSAEMMIFGLDPGSSQRHLETCGLNL
jgi:adenylate cyclase